MAPIYSLSTRPPAAKPRFTIPLEDQHVNEGSHLAWTCEAFGIPEVTYAWLRNGELLEPEV